MARFCRWTAGCTRCGPAAEQTGVTPQYLSRASAITADALLLSLGNRIWGSCVF